MKYIKALLIMLLVPLIVFSQKIETKTKSLPDFTKIVIYDGLKVKIFINTTCSASITTDNDGHKNLVVKVKDGVLTIYENGRAQLNFTPSPVAIHKTPIENEIVITAKQNLSSVILKANSTAIFEPTFETNKIAISAMGNSNIEGKINCNSMVVNLKEKSGLDISGNIENLVVKADNSISRLNNIKVDNCKLNLQNKSRIEAKGISKYTQITLNSSSRLEALGLASQKATANIDGKSELFINVSDSLKIDIQNNSKTTITGNPKIEKNVQQGCTLKMR